MAEFRKLNSRERADIAERAYRARMDGKADDETAEEVAVAVWQVRSLADWWAANRAESPEVAERRAAEWAELQDWADEVREQYEAANLSLKDAVLLAVKISQARRALYGLDMQHSGSSGFEATETRNTVPDNVVELLKSLGGTKP